jgi:hypothetical protein
MPYEANADFLVLNHDIIIWEKTNFQMEIRILQVNICCLGGICIQRLVKELLNHAQNNARSEVVVEDELFLFSTPW